jgi:hypothetical protein
MKIYPESFRPKRSFVKSVPVRLDAGEDGGRDEEEEEDDGQDELSMKKV